MLSTVELQNMVANSHPQAWESSIRFVLAGATVDVVAHNDEPTRAEIGELLAELEERTLLTPSHGPEFFEEIAGWSDGTPYARMSPVTSMSDEDAHSLHGLVSIDPDRDQIEAAPVLELVGRVARELAEIS